MDLVILELEKEEFESFLARQGYKELFVVAFEERVRENR